MSSRNGLTEEERYEAFMSLLSVWRVTRDPGLGEVIEFAGLELMEERDIKPATTVKAQHASFIEMAEELHPADLDAMLEIFFVGRSSGDFLKRLDKLEIWPDDPRIGSFILNELLSPRFHSAKKVWYRLIDMLPRHADPRAVDSIVIDHLFIARKKRALKALRAMETRELTEEESAHCDVLTAALDAGADNTTDATTDADVVRAAIDALAKTFGPPRKPYEKALAKRNHRNLERDLLLDVAENPDDDAPRLVYADWLLQKDDPWGELIQLQIAAAERPLTNEEKQREAELMAAHQKRWLGPLAEGIQDPVFKRGFLHACQLVWSQTGETRIRQVVGDPRWGTLYQLNGGNFATSRLISDPVMKNLRVLRRSDRRTFERLVRSKKPLALEEFQAYMSFGRDEGLQGGPGLPHLKRLEIPGVRQEDLFYRCCEIFDSPLGESLEEVLLCVYNADDVNLWWDFVNERRELALRKMSLVDGTVFQRYSRDSPWKRSKNDAK